MSGKKGRSGRRDLNTFKVDTPQKCAHFYFAMLLSVRKERLEYITDIYPELLDTSQNSQEHIGELLDIKRETVNRILNKRKL